MTSSLLRFVLTTISVLALLPVNLYAAPSATSLSTIPKRDADPSPDNVMIHIAAVPANPAVYSPDYATYEELREYVFGNDTEISYVFQALFQEFIESASDQVQNSGGYGIVLTPSNSLINPTIFGLATATTFDPTSDWFDAANQDPVGVSSKLANILQLYFYMTNQIEACLQPYYDSGGDGPWGGILVALAWGPDETYQMSDAELEAKVTACAQSSTYSSS